MKPEIKTIADEYIVAYKNYNTTRPDPILLYEGGWFLLTTFDEKGRSYPTRARKKTLVEMTERLRSYLKDTPSDEIRF